MDGRSRRNIEASQGDSFLSAHPCSARAWGAPVNLHGGNQPGYQHRRRGRAERTKLGARSSTTSILCKRGLDGVQAALPTLPKDSLWSIPCFTEAEALLSGAPNHSGEQDYTVRHYQ